MPTTVNLGRVQPIYKGAYAGGVTYTPLDFVSYDGVTYFCILTATGILPTNTTYWQPLANASAAGAVAFNDTSSVLVGANVQTALNSLGANALATRQFLGTHDATNLTTGLLPNARLSASVPLVISTTITLGNNFTGTDNLRLVKIGKLVTAQSNGNVGHASGFFASSAASIPAEYRPPVSVNFTGSAAGGVIDALLVTAGGQLSVAHRRLTDGLTHTATNWACSPISWLTA